MVPYFSYWLMPSLLSLILCRSLQNQAFSPSHIKSLIPVFREKAERVCIPRNDLRCGSHTFYPLATRHLRSTRRRTVPQKCCPSTARLSMPRPVFHPSLGERTPSAKYYRCSRLALSCDSRRHRRSRCGLCSCYSLQVSSPLQDSVTPFTPFHHRELILTAQTRQTTSLPVPLLPYFPLNVSLASLAFSLFGSPF
jgi:hypothetical protein